MRLLIFIPLAFTPDPNLVMGVSQSQTDTQAISLFDLTTREEEIIAVHPAADLSPIMSINQGRTYEVMGASYEYGEFDAVFFGDLEDEGFADTAIALMSQFPSQAVMINSATYDKNQLIVQTMSANHPAAFYLFDRTMNQLAEIARAPISHAQRLRDALAAQHDTDVKWLVKADEGHGFYDSNNNVERWTEMLSFLEEHIGEE